jgi:hypothetical protein
VTPFLDPFLDPAPVENIASTLMCETGQAMAKNELADMFEDLKEASTRPSNHKVLFEDSNAKIRLGTEVRDVPKMRIAMGRLDSLSVWHGRVGAVQVLEGDSGGWEKLKMSAIYKYWSIRFFVHAFLVDTRTVKATNADALGACLCFHHLISTGSFEEAAWLGAAIKRSRSNNSMNWVKILPRPFEAFTPRLFNAWQRLPVENRLEPYSAGVYQAVIDAWGDPMQLANPIKSACDYHMSQTDDPHDKGFPEFIEFLYAVFPVEIIAIRRVRSLLGLTTPSIDHPLLCSSLASPPANIDIPKDEVLSNLLSAARSMWPKL